VWRADPVPNFLPVRCRITAAVTGRIRLQGVNFTRQLRVTTPAFPEQEPLWLPELVSQLCGLREGFDVRHPNLLLSILLLVVTDPDPLCAESGLASYYGGAGRRGQITCAHRTRPLGTFVTVSSGGYSVRCRINDRGPFVRGRIIDVSPGAARALHMLRSGVIRVSVE
jgi:rare lipoprotein A